MIRQVSSRSLVGLVALAVTVVGLVSLVLVQASTDGPDKAAGRPSGSATDASASGSKQGTGAVGKLVEQPTKTPKPRPSTDPLPGLHRYSMKQVVRVRLPARAGSATGRLVSGYPVSVAPLPRGAVVRSSSVTAQGRRLQATLVAVYHGTPSGLLDRFRGSMTRVGLSGTQVPALGGARSFAFSDGHNQVTLTIRPAHGHSVPFTVSMTLRAAR